MGISLATVSLQGCDQGLGAFVIYRILVLLAITSQLAFSENHSAPERKHYRITDLSNTQYTRLVASPQESVRLPTVEEVMLEVRALGEEVSQSAIDAVFEKLDKVIKTHGRDGAWVVDQAIGHLLRRQTGISPTEFRLFLPIFEQSIKEGGRGHYSELARRIYSHTNGMVETLPEVRAIRQLGESLLIFVESTPQEKQEIRENLERYRLAFRALGDRKIDGKGISLLVSSLSQTAKFRGKKFASDLKEAFEPKKIKDNVVASLILANSASPYYPGKGVVRASLNEELGRPRLVQQADHTVDWKATGEKFLATAERDAQSVLISLAAAKVIDAEEYERGLNAIRNATLARKVVEEIRHLERDPQSGQLSPEAIQNLRKFGPDYLASVATQLEKNNAISPETRETVVKVALTATLTDQAADVVNKIDRDIRETREVWQKRGWIQAESPSQTRRR